MGAEVAEASTEAAVAMVEGAEEAEEAVVDTIGATTETDHTRHSYKHSQRVHISPLASDDLTSIFNATDEHSDVHVVPAHATLSYRTCTYFCEYCAASLASNSFMNRILRRYRRIISNTMGRNTRINRPLPCCCELREVIH